MENLVNLILPTFSTPKHYSISSIAISLHISEKITFKKHKHNIAFTLKSLKGDSLIIIVQFNNYFINIVFYTHFFTYIAFSLSLCIRIKS